MTRTGARSWHSWFVVGVLVALVVVSSVAHLWALHRDLPLHDPDESAFVAPAVHIAATGDLDPHWFGHPGSTVIYPLAALFHVRDSLSHPERVLSSDPPLAHRLHSDPTEFYVIGRLWSMALSVGALPLLFVLGRRVFNARVALVAVALWAVLPFPVFHAQIVRTDSAAVFFGLLALWLCTRLYENPGRRRCVLAGLSVGLAVASRYFMVALVPVLVLAAFLPRRRATSAALRSAALSVACAVGGFALTTPYFFLDWHTATRTLSAENVAAPGVPSGLSPVGNLRWYLGTAIPQSLTWPLAVLAGIGVVLVVRRPRAPRVLLLVFCGVFLLGLSLSKLHLQQWVIQVLPVLTLVAAFTVVTAAEAVTARLGRTRRTPVVAPLALIGITLVLAFDPISTLARIDADPSTGTAARSWIAAHLQPGSRVLEDSIHVPLDHTRLPVAYGLDSSARGVPNDAALGSDQYLRLDPHRHSMAFYRDAGYQYLVANAYWIGIAIYQPIRYPRAAAFYRDLVCHVRMVAAFRPSSTRHGWPIRIYRLTQEQRPPDLYICRSTS